MTHIFTRNARYSVALAPEHVRRALRTARRIHLSEISFRASNGRSVVIRPDIVERVTAPQLRLWRPPNAFSANPIAENV